MRQNWKDNEIKIKEVYSTTDKYKILELFRRNGSYRSWISIFKKANKLGLRKLYFKKEIDEILQKYYSNFPLKFVLKEVRKYSSKINKIALIARANRLGLTRRTFAGQEMQKKVTIPKPSKELAWFLGVLAGDGYVSPLINKEYSYTVQLAATSPEFVQKFSKVGRKLFGIKPCLRNFNAYKLRGKWRKYYVSAFYSKKLVLFFGNWKENIWPKTLKESFNWILKNKSFARSFLTGYFDSEGSAIYNDRPTRRATIAVMNKDAQEILRIMLKQVRIKGKFYWKGIQIDGKKEAKNFANQITSCIPHKQKILNILKEM